MHRHSVEYIEYADRAALVEALPHLQGQDGVVHIDVIDLGRTLRVTRLVDGSESTETLSDASGDAGGTPPPTEPSGAAESLEEDLIGEAPEEEDWRKFVHDSSLAEIEAAVAAGSLTGAEVLAYETGKGGRDRQNVKYAFRAAE